MHAGMQLNGYTLLAPLQGANGDSLWKARDTSGSMVAIKSIYTTLAGDTDLAKQSAIEAQKCTRLCHPNIVPTRAPFWHGEKLYRVTDYYASGSLADKLKQLPDHRMRVSEALDLATQLLAALNFAHEHMIIHGAVKPSSILLLGTRALLEDFGIALDAVDDGFTTVDGSLEAAEYTSPEQILAPNRVNHLSDVYSIGCVLYTMLAGRPPFIAQLSDSDAIREIQQKHVNEAPAPIRQFNPEVSERLDHIVRVALAKNPNERFPGCGSFAHALTGIRPLNACSKGSEVGRRLHVPRSNVSGPLRTFTRFARQVRLALTRWSSSQAEALQTMLRSFTGLALFLPFWPVLGVRPAFTLALLFQLVSSFTTFLLVVYAGWRTIDDGKSLLRPREAALLLLVPFFNLYWGYHAVARFGYEYKLFVQRNKLQLSRVASGIYGALYSAIVVLCVLEIAALFTRPRLIGEMLVLQTLLLIPALTWMMNRATVRLQEASPTSCWRWSDAA